MIPVSEQGGGEDGAQPQNHVEGIPEDRFLLASIDYFNEHNTVNPSGPIFYVETDPERNDGLPSLAFSVPHKHILYEGQGGTPSLSIKTSSFALKKWLRGRNFRPKLVYDTRHFSLCEPVYLLRGWWLWGAPSDILYSNVRILLQETRPSSPQAITHLPATTDNV